MADPRPARSVLQRFVLPTYDVCTETSLYLRPGPGAEHSLLDGTVKLRDGGTVSFDTWFNTFSVSRWRRHTTLEHLVACVDVDGPVLVEAIHEVLGGDPVVVADAESSGGRATVEVVVPPLAKLGEGQVSLRVTGRGDARVLGAAFATDDAPARTVRLGAVITTFNRQPYVTANLRRLVGALERNPDARERLQVLVVDNGRNLEVDLPDGLPVRVLPNPNLGGAGGFARGLIELRDGGWATHALFMDDDAILDPEAVLRTVELLAFARDPLLCLSGTMLREREPALQFEAGARYLPRSTYPIRPQGTDVDLADRFQVLRADAERPFDYAAWWFFAFPLALTTANPLPAFIRGDDICFGVMHARGHLTTWNGIGVWHADFEPRNNPSSWFYDTRNLALISLLADPGFRWWHCTKRFVDIGLRSVLGFKYASAEKIIEGMHQFLEGPEHWMTIDHEATNTRARQFDGERAVPLDRALLEVEELPVPSPPRKLAMAGLSVLLLGGHLLPASLRRRPLGAVPLQARALGATINRDELLYRYEPTGEGFVAARDPRRFWPLLAGILRTGARIPFRYRKLARAYRAAYPEMTGDAYWRRQFDA